MGPLCKICATQMSMVEFNVKTDQPHIVEDQYLCPDRHRLIVRRCTVYSETWLDERGEVVTPE